MVSKGIDHLAWRVGEEVRPMFTLPRDALFQATEIAGPGFGVLGEALLGDTYREVQQMAQAFLHDGDECARGWQDALRTCAHNWRLAEDANMVKYQ
ncbi:hypothetical protein [Nonomuraea roseola]|uniref:DUF5753 domain-containing protein n=1 Tax=Nonomuraea roseola TaxID=46179 RepID=A0ABV5PQG5_9ACTN